MTFGRSLRRWLSACTVFALLLMQFATLAHACPLLAATDSQPASSSAQAVPCADKMMQAMPCADTMAQASDSVPQDLPAVCVKHCQPEPQGVDAGAGPVLSAPLLVSMLPIVPADEAAADGPAVPGVQAEPHATPPPPLSILNCCWRI